MNTENHYQETDLGNISLNPRGEYNPEESYEYLDLVVLEGGSYVCLAENGATITGISPESGKTTQYWQVITIPGSLTPEYIAMHDRVVNLSEQVGADAVEVRTAEQNVSGMELNVTQMQEQTRQSAEAAEQSKDSSAGYAASADASRQAAEESKQNIDAQVTGFDSHVAEKTEEAENDIEAARIAANKAIIAQQEESVNEVARAGIEAISTAQSAAQTATEKAQAADTSEKNAAASETAAKLSEANATKMAEQVAADKEQVAYDRTAVENAKQEMTGSVAQIEKNTQGIADLKGDLAELNTLKSNKYVYRPINPGNLGEAQSSGNSYLLKDKDINGGCAVYVKVLYAVNPNVIRFHLFEIINGKYVYKETKTGESVYFDLTSYDYSRKFVVGFTGEVKYTMTEGLPMYQANTDTFDVGSTYSFYAVVDKSYFYVDVYSVPKIDTIVDKLFDFSKNVITVAKDGKGDFTAINDALNYAYTIESSDNPITIIINPGVYNEVCNVKGNHYVSLIGVNRNDCIIRNDSGIYDNCPLKIEGNAMVKNLTLIATHKNNSSLVVDGIVQTNPSYGLHIDDRHADNDNDYKITVENCYIYSEQNPAVGIGLDKNQTVELLNCELISNIANDILNATGKLDGVWGWKPNGGALFYHALYSGSYTDDNGYQKLIVKDCVMRNNAPNVAFGEGGGMEEQVTLEFINNVGYSTNNGTSFVKGLYSATISPFSYGNNCEAMNYHE